MAKIRFLGGEETGNVGSVQWGRFSFEINKWVDCDDPHIIAKARNNRFYEVDGGAGVTLPNPTPMPTKKPVVVKVEAPAAPVRRKPGPKPKPKAIEPDESDLEVADDV